MEREFLLGIDFGLYVDKTTYESWLNLLKGLVMAKERDSKHWQRSRCPVRTSHLHRPHCHRHAHAPQSRAVSHRARSSSPRRSSICAASHSPAYAAPPPPAVHARIHPPLALRDARSLRLPRRFQAFRRGRILPHLRLVPGSTAAPRTGSKAGARPHPGHPAAISTLSGKLRVPARVAAVVLQALSWALASRPRLRARMARRPARRLPTDTGVCLSHGRSASGGRSSGELSSDLATSTAY